MKTLCLIAFYTFIVYPTFAKDNYSFRHLAVEDGLSQNSVYTIMQDNRGFMWFGTQEGLNRYDGYEFITFKRNKKEGNISDNVILSLYQCAQGKIWIGTRSGINIYSPQMETFTEFKDVTKDSVPISVSVRDIQCDNIGNKWFAASSEGIFELTVDNKLIQYTLPESSVQKKGKGDFRKIAIGIDNQIWIATYSHGLCRANRKTKKIEPYPLNGQFENYDINDLYFIDSQTILLGTIHNGLLELNIKTGQCKSLLKKNENGQPLFVRKIIRRKNGDLWLGTESGLCVYNLRSGRAEFYRHIFNDTYSIADNAIHSVYEDREGGMWLGTYFGGINYMFDSHSVFEKYYPVEGINSLSGKSVSEFCEDENGNLWIGTEDFGLNYFNVSLQQFKNYYLPWDKANSFSHSNIHGLLYNNPELWIGTYSQGIDVLNTHTGTSRSYKSSNKKNTLLSNNIYSIYKNKQDVIWIGSEKGLQYFNQGDDNFIRVNKDIDCQVNDIKQSANGLMWVATIGKGVFCYNASTQTWKQYKILPNEAIADGQMITCIMEDDTGNIWIGTEGAGMCFFDVKKEAFISINTTHGLPNNVVYMLLQDEQGDIWGSTNKGIFSYDPQSKEIRVFGHSSGLLGDQFNYKSGILLNKKIYFGGVKGFIAFNPERLTKNTIIPKIEITRLSVNNNALFPGDKKKILQQSISFTREINLKHDENNFSFNFAALSFVSPEMNKYICRLEGIDNDWKVLDKNQTVKYSNLNPGTYIFMLKASNSDGIWQEQPKTLRIKIRPPFYLSWLAYITYFIITAGLIYLIIRLNTQKQKRKNNRLLEKLNNEKEKEIFQSKIEFFTNITHEIRTPLSLIKVPLDILMKKINHKDKQYANLVTIQKNTDRLLDLTNQLLDFRKSEAGNLKLNYTHTDVIFIVKETLLRFSLAAKSEGKTITFNTKTNAFFADIDIEVVTKTLSNLINNGIKFSKDQIIIDFDNSDEHIFLKIKSNGKIIEEKDREQIFQPFYKIDEHSQGSGLGLPLIKSLISLHDGELYLDPVQKDFNVFVVKLPISQKRQFTIQESALSFLTGKNEAPQPELSDTTTRHTVLLIEDNEELSYFMKQQFDEEFNVLLAPDGKSGLSILEAEPVDLIISDLMMPVMDGIELCKIVRSKLSMSHIPFIMLSAQSNLQFKVNSLKTGADDYIEKPYSYEFLRARIYNLLTARKRIKQLYQNSPDQDIKPIAHTRADEEFLTKLIGLIHEKLDDINLDVDVLSALMNMSRASLYRKLKGISELTPNDFIRLTRLKKASQLLNEGQYRINEIADIVGFSSPSYFSKCFHKQFGVLPKDFGKVL